MTTKIKTLDDLHKSPISNIVVAPKARDQFDRVFNTLQELGLRHLGMLTAAQAYERYSHASNVTFNIDTNNCFSIAPYGLFTDGTGVLPAEMFLESVTVGFEPFQIDINSKSQCFVAFGLLASLGVKVPNDACGYCYIMVADPAEATVQGLRDPSVKCFRSLDSAATVQEITDRIKDAVVEPEEEEEEEEDPEAPEGPRICNYTGTADTDEGTVEFGCAVLDVEWLRGLLAENGGNRTADNVRLNSGVTLSQDEIQSIIDYYEAYDEWETEYGTW